MPKISLPVLPAPWEDDDATPERRSIFEVLGIVNEGASPRGSTYWKSLFTCPREHAYRYVLGFRALQMGEALTIGLLFHKAMEDYYRAIMEFQQSCERPKAIARKYRPAWEHFWWGGCAEAAKKAMAGVSPLADEPGYRDTWSTLERILGAYFDTYWKADEWEIYAVEETLMHESAKFTYSVRLDLLVYDFVQQGLKVVEHKTARTITADLVDNYQMDLQILGQIDTFKRVVDTDAYPPLLGVDVNITTKQLQPKLDRVPVNPSKLHLAAFSDAMASWNRLRGYYEGEAWPRALGKCAGAARGYGKCEFYDLCHGHPEMGVEDWEEQGPPIGFEKVDAE